RLIENVRGLKEVLDDKVFRKVAKEQLEMIEEISERISVIISEKEAMIETRKKLNKLTDMRKMAIGYCEDVVPFLDKIRYQCDKLEMLIDDELWPLPKYRELLFN
ncbi:MAG TPA: glutamine synthetase type III, partial [Cryomorphaceae bacterium]|nr:glutamine synthetase type III [Cryomorphaceae bacterium]